MAALLVQSET